MSWDWSWKPRPRVGALRSAAERERSRLAKSGRAMAPVVIEGRGIARTFWGRAWCDNLERYGDFENRLPRGRSYVRNGLVIHLEVAAGAVRALVRGTSLYEVTIGVTPLPVARWDALRADSAGAIDSLVELLQGRFSDRVMERMCRREGGLFPAPKELTFACTCPDWASMCKHVAAVLYGVGARLDEQPELLFRLRGVDENDLVTSAADARLGARRPRAGRVLAGADLSAMFGLEVGGGSTAPARPTARSTKGAAAGASAARKVPVKAAAKTAAAKTAAAKTAAPKKAPATKAAPKKAPATKAAAKGVRAKKAAKIAPPRSGERPRRPRHRPHTRGTGDSTN